MTSKLGLEWAKMLMIFPRDQIVQARLSLMEMRGTLTVVLMDEKLRFRCLALPRRFLLVVVLFRCQGHLQLFRREGRPQLLRRECRPRLVQAFRGEQSVVPLLTCDFSKLHFQTTTLPHMKGEICSKIKINAMLL